MKPWLWRIPTKCCFSSLEMCCKCCIYRVVVGRLVLPEVEHGCRSLCGVCVGGMPTCRLLIEFIEFMWHFNMWQILTIMRHVVRPSVSTSVAFRIVRLPHSLNSHHTYGRALCTKMFQFPSVIERCVPSQIYMDYRAEWGHTYKYHYNYDLQVCGYVTSLINSFRIPPTTTYLNSLQWHRPDSIKEACLYGEPEG